MCRAMEDMRNQTIKEGMTNANFPPPQKNDSPGFKKIRKLTLYTICNKIKEK